MPSPESKQLEIFTAQLDIPLPLCGGKVRAVGNRVLLLTKADKTRIAFHVLARGEWDGIDRLWVNRKLIDHTDTTKVHFHPGIEGVLGHGLNPDSNGGDQKVDNFFSEFPAYVQRLTFSGKAYLVLKIADDPAAPSAELEVLGDYRTTKVRIFDASGSQTAYQYSTNPAWLILDLLIRMRLKPEGLVGEALTADEKARVDFPSFVDAADDYDYDIGGGIKRAEINVAWPNQATLTARLEQLLVMCRSYLRDVDGKIQLIMDQARASTFILSSDHYVPGSLKVDEDYGAEEPNHYIGNFNDLNLPVIANIETPGNNGAVRAANVVTITTVADHNMVAGMDCLLAGITDNSFNGMVASIATAPTSKTFTFAQAGANATSGSGTVTQEEQRFVVASKILDHEEHQLAIGQRGVGLSTLPRKIDATFDFGNNTAERVTRMMLYQIIRNLGLDQALSDLLGLGALPAEWRAPKVIRLQAFMDAVDATDRALSAQLAGDVITIERSVSEEFQGDYEILEITPLTRGSSSSRGGGESGGGRVMDLFLKAYVPEAFTDTGGPQQPFYTLPQASF